MRWGVLVLLVAVTLLVVAAVHVSRGERLPLPDSGANVQVQPDRK